jgi:nitric oxide reductase NorQ protein
LIQLATRLRALKGQDLEEAASTRLVVHCARLIASGVKLELAVRTALIEPLSDDPEVKEGLMHVAEAVLG